MSEMITVGLVLAKNVFQALGADAPGRAANAIAMLRVLVAALTQLETEFCKLDAVIARRAKENDVARRLMTVPGAGPLIATAIAVMASLPETFLRARDFAAWFGLTPRQHSTGGRQRRGATPRMGERSLRRRLITGANSGISSAMPVPGPGQAPGWQACCPASRRYWCASPWPTRWRVSSGR